MRAYRTQNCAVSSFGFQTSAFKKGVKRALMGCAHKNHPKWVIRNGVGWAGGGGGIAKESECYICVIQCAYASFRHLI